MLWEQWPQRWAEALDSCKRMGGITSDLHISSPASVQDVLSVEQELGREIPQSFREVLTGFASSVNVRWQTPDNFHFVKPFHGIFSGECCWDLHQLVKMEEGRQLWLGCFPNLDDPYDRVWHHKLTFWDVANGDALALDLAQPYSPVVYLSHDDGKGHGYILGKDFADFINRWTTLGCVGSEDWQMLPFLPTPFSGLEVNGENAVRWRQLFSLREN